MPLSLVLKKLNRKIPKVTITPIQSLLLPNFKELSLTLEQNKATSITDSKLQDLTMTTAGNEASCTALL